jgi:hypothetical protein
MIITSLLLLFAALALILFVLRSVSTSRRGPDEEELQARIRPVDLEAFRNLTDPSEEQFLRDNLPPSEFRAIQRQRLRAAIDYLGGASHNAALLLQLGQTARRSADARIADAGRNLVDEAVRLRLYSLLARGKLCARFVLPEAAWHPAGIVDRYQHLTEGAAQLGRLQYPERGSLVSRAL